jgi:hypothetical protein
MLPRRSMDAAGLEGRHLIGRPVLHCAQLEVVQTQVRRSLENVVTTGGHWKAARLEKGWRRLCYRGWTLTQKEARMRDRWLTALVLIGIAVISYSAMRGASVTAQSPRLMALKTGQTVTLVYAPDAQVRCEVSGFSGDTYVRCGGGPAIEHWYNLATVREVIVPTSTSR